MSALPLPLILRTRWKMLCLMAVALFMCAAAAVYFTRYLVKPYYGLTAPDPLLNQRRGGLIFNPEKSDSPALKAGILPGQDKITAINGRPLSTIRELCLWDYGHFSFEPVNVSVTGPDGTSRSVMITPQLSVSQYDWFFSLFFIIIMSGIAVYILSQYHHEITHTLFALLVLCYTAYTAVRPFSYENLLAAGFVNLGELTAWLTILLIVLFQKDVLPKPVRNIMIAVVLTITAGFTGVRYYAASRWFLLGSDGTLAFLRDVDLFQNYGDILAYMVFLFFLVFTYVKTRHGEIKQHLEWIAAGALLSIPPHFFFNQVPQFIGQDKAGFPQLGLASSFFLVFLPLSYVIGLVRARGFRIRILQSRSVVYFIVSFVLLAFFSVAWQPVYRYFSSVLRLPEVSAGFVVGLSLFITALYLQLVILLIVDHRLLRDRKRNRGLESGVFLESPGEVVSAARSREQNADYETLVGGVINRCGRVVEQLRKYHEETKKYLPCHTGDNRTDQKGEEDEKHSGERPVDRLFSRIQKQVVGFEDFRKRFDHFASDRGTTRISFSLDTLMDPLIKQCLRRWNGLDIRYRKKPGLKLFCSPEDLTLCLQAVMNNACEALVRREDGIVISADEESETVVLEVSDRGAGITLKQMAFAGRPFFTTKRGHDGLGLFFTRLLLERNGGTCRLEPGSETGTKVIFRLPKIRKKPATRAEDLI